MQAGNGDLEAKNTKHLENMLYTISFKGETEQAIKELKLLREQLNTYIATQQQRLGLWKYIEEEVTKLDQKQKERAEKRKRLRAMQKKRKKEREKAAKQAAMADVNPQEQKGGEVEGKIEDGVEDEIEDSSTLINVSNITEIQEVSKLVTTESVKTKEASKELTIGGIFDNIREELQEAQAFEDNPVREHNLNQARKKAMSSLSVVQKGGKEEAKEEEGQSVRVINLKDLQKVVDLKRYCELHSKNIEGQIGKSGSRTRVIGGRRFEFAKDIPAKKRFLFYCHNHDFNTVEFVKAYNKNDQTAQDMLNDALNYARLLDQQEMTQKKSRKNR